MHSLATAIVKAGILSPETLQEFRKWGFPVEEPTGRAHGTPEEVTQAVEDALQSEGLILSRETDLEAANLFLRSMLKGELHVVMEDEGGDAFTDVDCVYGKTPLGEFIIRWYSESISDVLTNGKTYLKQHSGCRTYFKDAREVFFGQTKAFVICTPSFEEELRELSA